MIARAQGHTEEALTEAIKDTLSGVNVFIPMGRAHQDEVDRTRDRLQQLILSSTDQPIEILTLPDNENPNSLGFFLRRFA